MDINRNTALRLAAVGVIILTAGCSRANEKLKEPVSESVINTDTSMTAPEKLFWSVENRNGVQYLVDKENNGIVIKTYSRIVLLSPGAVETLYLIGGEGAIAGIATSRDPIWPEEKTALIPSVGNNARPSLEGIIMLNPDLIIGNAMNGSLIEDLNRQGYAAILHAAESIADILNGAILLGRLTGTEEAARGLAAEKTAVLAGLKEAMRTDPLELTGAFLYSASPPTAFTEDSLAGEVLDILGVENIAAGLNAAQPILSPEYMLARNPDFLFGAMAITKPEDMLAADSVIAQTRAGQEGNIKIIPSSLFLRPSPRLIDGLPVLRNELEGYRKKSSGTLR